MYKSESLSFATWIQRTRRFSMAIGKFLFTIRIKAWWWNINRTGRYLRISKNGKLYYVFAQKIHIYSHSLAKIDSGATYIVLHRTTLTCPGCVWSSYNAAYHIEPFQSPGFESVARFQTTNFRFLCSFSHSSEREYMIPPFLGLVLSPSLFPRRHIPSFEASKIKNPIRAFPPSSRCLFSPLPFTSFSKPFLCSL